jgi:hypothetical protein
MRGLRWRGAERSACPGHRSRWPSAACRRGQSRAAARASGFRPRWVCAFARARASRLCWSVPQPPPRAVRVCAPLAANYPYPLRQLSLRPSPPLRPHVRPYFRPPARPSCVCVASPSPTVPSKPPLPLPPTPHPTPASTPDRRTEQYGDSSAASCNSNCSLAKLLFSHFQCSSRLFTASNWSDFAFHQAQ